MATATKANTMAQDFVALYGALNGKVVRDSKNPHFRSSYASAASLVDTLRPTIVANNFAYIQWPTQAAGGMLMNAKLLHISGDEMVFDPMFVPVDKANAQGVGSALTYAQRYQTKAIFNIAEDDDDGNEAAKAPPNMDKELEPFITAIENSIDMDELKGHYEEATKNARMLGADTSKIIEATNKMKEKLNG